jgi:hypothetical protein
MIVLCPLSRLACLPTIRLYWRRLAYGLLVILPVTVNGLFPCQAAGESRPGPGQL